MTYGFAISQQLSLFLYSLGFGFLSGVYYRFIMTVRKEISEKKTAYIVFDVFFCVSLTVFTFCFFLVYTDGQVRLISILACVIGFIIYIFSVDVFLKKLMHFPVTILISSVKLLFLPLTFILRLLRKGNKRISEKIKVKKQNHKAEKKTKKRQIKNPKTHKSKIKENVWFFSCFHLKNLVKSV